MSTTPNNLASYIWSLADLLRGDFKQSQYRPHRPPIHPPPLHGVRARRHQGRRLHRVPTVLDMNLPEDAHEKFLLSSTGGLSCFNTSLMDLSKLAEASLKENLESYLQGFSKDAREIFEHFKFAEFIDNSDVHQNQKMQLLSDATRSSKFAREIFDLLRRVG